jgi:hypothetical protein
VPQLWKALEHYGMEREMREMRERGEMMERGEKKETRATNKGKITLF